MKLIDRLTKPKADIQPLNFDQWLDFFNFNGTGYPFPQINQTYAGGKTQEILPTFTSLGNTLLSRNGIVWACVATANMLFADATFQFRRFGSTTSGDLYGTTALQALETPWPGGTTRKLLALMDLHVQLAGNAYAARDPQLPNTIRVLRPDWMTIILGSRSDRLEFQVGDPDTEIIGYAYRPGGDISRQTIYLPEQMAHFMPHPDPLFPFRGASWIPPVVQEIMADNGMNEHKLSFLQNGATPNMVVTLAPGVNQTQFDQWIEKFEEGHASAANAYRTIYLAGGADAKVVGSNLKELDFRPVQAHSETRVCNAAGIPPIIVGVSEGLDSATYSNYAQAKRAWADSRLHPRWAGVCSELGKLVSVPGGSELWYDERKIKFLAEDLQDQAEIQQTQAATISTLTNAGFTPESSAAYVESGDLTVLTHTGLFSVQLQPPGTDMTPAQTAAAQPPVAQAVPMPPVEPRRKFQYRLSLHGDSLDCGLCGEPAASNAARCPSCAQIGADLETARSATVASIVEHFGLEVEATEIALRLRMPSAPALKLLGSPKDYLTPTPSRDARLT